MQEHLDAIQEANIQLVAISYDSVDVLANFAKKENITFPLLSDPESRAIQAYGVFNTEAKGRQAGIPHPATFLIDRHGVVRATLPGTVRKRHSAKDLLKVAQEKLAG